MREDSFSASTRRVSSQKFVTADFTFFFRMAFDIGLLSRLSADGSEYFEQSEFTCVNQDFGGRGVVASV